MCGLGGWAAWRGLRARTALAAPLAAALAGLVVTQQFIVFVVATALIFLLAIALLVAALPQGALPNAKPRFHREMAIADILASVVLLAYAVQLMAADTALAAAQRKIAGGDAMGAARIYRTVLRWQPAGSSADLDYSRAMQELWTDVHRPASTRLVARAQAVEAGIRATNTAEARQNAWYNLAILLAAGSDAAGMERSLRNAIACSPHWFKPHWALAQLLEMTGRHSEALREAQAAVELDGSRDAEVVETWRRLSAAGGGSKR
jgi:tetratricopeptide (TPR) repeat protein